MRISGTYCSLCGKRSHVSGDGLCVLVRNVESRIGSLRKEFLKDHAVEKNLNKDENHNKNSESGSKPKNEDEPYRKRIVEICWKDLKGKDSRPKKERNPLNVNATSRAPRKGLSAVEAQLKVDSIRQSWPYQFSDSGT